MNSLNEHTDNDATFYFRVHGDSMIGAGIHDGDLLVADRYETAGHNKIVIVTLDGKQDVKRLIRRNEKVFLAPEHPAYSAIDITNEHHVHVLGVVKYTIRELLRDC
jgi:DNA polymerase V